MKITGILTHNNCGGAQKAMSKLQASIVSKGVGFNVLYLYGKSGDVMDNGEVLVSSETSKFLRYFLVIFFLFRYLHNNKPDAVISFLPFSNVLTGIISVLMNIKNRVVSHRNPVWTYSALLRWLDRLFGWLGVYTAIVANSNAVKSSLDNYPVKYKDKLHVISNGVDIPSLFIDSDEIKAKYGLNTTDVLILSVGRLTQQKRYDLLLDAFAELQQGVLVIAGHGELQEELKERARSLGVLDKVCFIGAVQHADIVKLLFASDIYIQTSEFEGQSNALLEAIAAACVVISSDIPPQREVLIDKNGKECGVLIDSLDPKVWAGALTELMVSPCKRTEYSSLAKERSKDFSVERMADGFLVLCDK